MPHIDSPKLSRFLNGFSCRNVHSDFSTGTDPLPTLLPPSVVDASGAAGADQVATMVFILGVNFHEMKLVKKAVESFYAIGPQTSARILAKFSIHPRAKMGTLPAKAITGLTAELSNMTIENDARRIVQDNIKRLREMGTYRGKRHAMGLPVRGQRTRTQILTARKLNRLERK